MGERMTKKVAFILFLIVVFSICMFGCSGKDDAQTESVTPQPGKVNLLECTWKDYEKIQDDPALENDVSYLELFRKKEDTEVQLSKSFVNAEGAMIVYLQWYYTMDGEKATYGYGLQFYNSVTGQKTKVDIDGKSLASGWKADYPEEDFILEGYEKGTISINAMDVGGEKVYALWTLYDEKWLPMNCFLTEIGADGKVLSSVRVEEKLWKEKAQTTQIYSPKIYCGNNGTFYIFDEADLSVLFHMDSNGNLLEEISLEFRNDGQLTRTNKTEDGDCVFQYTDATGASCIFVIKDGKKKDLYNGKKSVSNAIWDEEGGITFLQADKLVRWNPGSGECVGVCDLDGIDVTKCRALEKNSQGKWIVLLEDNTWVYGYLIRPGVPAENTVLHMAQLDAVDTYPKTCATDYSRKHPNVQIEVSVPGKNDSGERLGQVNKLVEEMKAGKGPDILLVNREEMEILQAAGCLDTIDDVMTDELNAMIFDGVLEYGSVDGNLYGLPFEANAGTMLVNADFWTEDHWNMEQVMNLWEQMEQKGKAPNRFEALSYAASPNQILYDIATQNMNDIPFIDWKTGKASFDSEQFTTLLRFCKEKGEETNKIGNLTPDEMYAQMRDGEALALNVQGGLLQFSNSMAALEDSCHIVGYPAEQGSGGMVYCYWMLVVNKWTGHKEIVKDFLRDVLSEENQLKYTTNWIRRDIFEEHVKEHTNIADTPILVVDENGFTPLSGRKDGTSFLKEYMDIMENGHTIGSHTQVRDIIMEEAQVYFDDGRSAEETAKIIQNRVQLYLDEGK